MKDDRIAHKQVERYRLSVRSYNTYGAWIAQLESLCYDEGEKRFEWEYVTCPDCLNLKNPYMRGEVD